MASSMLSMPSSMLSMPSSMPYMTSKAWPNNITDISTSQNIN